MKKKMSLLMAAALCVTIGGVYATWSYAQNEITTPASGNMALTLTGVDSSTAKGTISVVGTNVGLKVDDKGGHVTELETANASGYFTVTFAPSDIADDTVQTNGIAINWYVGYSFESAVVDTNSDGVTDYKDWVYNYDTETEQIFENIDTDPTTMAKYNAATAASGTEYTAMQKNADGSFSFKVSIETVMDKLSLNDITLNIHDKYLAYETALGYGHLHFYAVEAIA